VRVRGAAKVIFHLMFGLVALTVTALFAPLCGSPHGPPQARGGPKIRSETRRGGRCAVIRIAKPVEGNVKRVYHRRIARQLTRSPPPAEVLKMAHHL
jgi:hypothetical protein